MEEKENKVLNLQFSKSFFYFFYFFLLKATLTNIEWYNIFCNKIFEIAI